jgi:ribosomal protein L35
MKNKPSKSVSKRIAFTKNGKVVRRPMAVDHFRTRQSAKNIRSKRKGRSLDYPLKTVINY